MSGNEGGAVPRQARVSVAVEMDQIRLQSIFEVQQPVAGVLHVGPAVRHPLEFVVTLEEVEIADAACVGGLSGAQRWSHHRQKYFDAVRLQRTRQLKRIGPDATDGVGSHENASRRLSTHRNISRSGAKPVSKFVLGRGQYHLR